MQLESIKLVLTDCDGVLTDGGVYYGESGEVLKKFNIRDGMGVERLRKLGGIQTGIITGEISPSLVKRAEKLQISELHVGIKDKERVLSEILEKYGLQPYQVAYIGDDVNDLVVLPFVGVFFCPADALDQVKKVASRVLSMKGGEGCFREMAELILQAQGIY
ncbi:KdsC family phosphatase [Aquirufa nivalisilvae]|uniref:KdsC family phosphatase n=1 Tax=Aquirufa nivalisilvae TaxID=2516557 RepID=UPI0010329200|nr:HAD family hydrolase [Aquirufa nivalisilvae]TBH76552.1 3-deoxy-D-manno-octulosonate 8-phosphate phosphatase [Aquirufa nivalisilvae]